MIKIELDVNKISELTGIRMEVLRFASLMEIVLKDNDHKGGWGNCDIYYLSERIHDEIIELNDALDELLKKERSHPRIMNVRKEAVDVANLAMMIADNVSKM